MIVLKKNRVVVHSCVSDMHICQKHGYGCQISFIFFSFKGKLILCDLKSTCLVTALLISNHLMHILEQVFGYEKTKFCFKLYFLLRIDENDVNGWRDMPCSLFMRPSYPTDTCSLNSLIKGLLVQRKAVTPITLILLYELSMILDGTNIFRME